MIKETRRVVLLIIVYQFTSCSGQLDQMLRGCSVPCPYYVVFCNAGIYFTSRSTTYLKVESRTRSML